MRPGLSSVRSIFAPIASFRFNPAQFDDCSKFLETRAESTERFVITDSQQLVMGPDGRLVENGYRFNSLGFTALTTALAVGLNPLFHELSGETVQMRAVPKKEFDVAAAVSVYNTALNVRFEAVRERNLLVNNAEKSVDGCLGIDHKFLDNFRFWQLVCDEIAAKQPHAEFYRAEVVGRELRMYFVNPRSRRNDIFSDSRHTFAAGWCFSNREDTGKSIRANSCLFTKFGLAIAPDNKKLNHLGADLEGRTAILISKAAEQEIDMDVVAKGLRALAAMSMNFSDDPGSFDAAMHQRVAQLARFKISREDAKRIIKNTAAVGSDLNARDVMEVYTGEVLRARNGYDLFCSILNSARSAFQTQRDVLQHAAMQLILPKKKSAQK
jgi:hypothetical protein